MSPDITNVISSSGVNLPPTLVLNTFSFFQIDSFGNILLLLLLSQFLQVELCHPKREVEVLNLGICECGLMNRVCIEAIRLR